MNEKERNQLHAILQSEGWNFVNGRIIAPSGGLWLSEEHFGTYTLTQVRDTFRDRAERIEKAKIGEWKTPMDENRQLSEAAASLI